MNRDDEAADRSRYHSIKTGSRFAISLLLAAIALAVTACTHARVKPFVPDRTTPNATINTLAWAMQHNDANLIAACFAPESRFITRLGGSEGLATVSTGSPPGEKEQLYWQNLRIVSITDTEPDEAVIVAESVYLGEMISIVLKKDETGWVIASADAYSMPREVRYPTTSAPTVEAK